MTELEKLLDDAHIHRLVFETFGLRRYTQDSPIQPDVWEWFLKLAARNNLGRRISLILTPKETPSKDGSRPPGGAGKLAEELRSRILGRSRSEDRRPRRKKGEPIDPAARTAEAILHDFKIAATGRNVVIEANFSEVLTYVLPVTAWWAGVEKKGLHRPDSLINRLAGYIEKGTTIREALVQLHDTEFYRFAALTALTCLIGNADKDDPQQVAEIKAFVNYLSPLRPKDDVESLDEKTPSQHTVKDVAPLWDRYKEMAEQTFLRQLPGWAEPAGQVKKAASIEAEVYIWSIQRNRKAQHESIVTGPIRASRQTVKADAAIMLFSISAVDLTWAVVDTGIDATHPAFNDDPPKSAPPAPDQAAAPSNPVCRVIATLDFTRLQSLLSEELDVDALLKAYPVGPSTVPEAQRKRNLQATIDSIRRRNVNGRELDWSLLEPIIRIAKDARRPADPHGTHVAGILAGKLDNGIPGDSDAFLGICPDIRLYDLRVFGEDENGKPLGGDEFTILAALDYITWANRDPERPRIHGVNLSLSLRHEVDAHACGRTPICDACNRLVSNGTVVVAAAGNAGFDVSLGKTTLGSGYRGTSITDPGNAELVITVGATHRSDPHAYGVSYFSSRGPTGDGRQKPDLVAPGEKIRSTVPNEQMLIKDGTSMAAPHVSGICALLMARNRELIGEPKRIKDVLMATATDLGRERSFQGAGLVDALRALQAI